MSRAKEKLAELEHLENTAEILGDMYGTEMTPERQHCLHKWDVGGTRRGTVYFDELVGRCHKCGIVRFIHEKHGTKERIVQW